MTERLPKIDREWVEAIFSEWMKTASAGSQLEDYFDLAGMAARRARREVLEWAARTCCVHARETIKRLTDDT